MTSETDVFISWTRGNPRTRDLGRRLPLNVYFVSEDGILPFRYVKQTLKTWRILRQRSPQVIMLMLPPFPLLLLVWLYAKTHKAKLVADMHTGAFNDPKWMWTLPLSLRLLRGHTAIVTNSFLAQQCESADVRAMVLHDPIDVYDTGQFKTEKDTILCPVSYANDEPIENILKAAATTPEYRWILTGRAPAHVQRSAPANVSFSGFVDDEKFNEMMEQAALVVALTTRPHTMQRAGYEALCFGVPQVTSDFKVLREFLDKAALYTDLSSEDIASKVQSALSARDEILRDVLVVRGNRMKEQEEQLSGIASLLSNARQQ